MIWLSKYHLRIYKACFVRRTDRVLWNIIQCGAGGRKTCLMSSIIRWSVTSLVPSYTSSHEIVKKYIWSNIKMIYFIIFHNLRSHLIIYIYHIIIYILVFLFLLLPYFHLSCLDFPVITIYHSYLSIFYSSY